MKKVLRNSQSTTSSPRKRLKVAPKRGAKVPPKKVLTERDKATEYQRKYRARLLVDPRLQIQGFMRRMSNSQLEELRKYVLSKYMSGSISVT